MALKEYQAKRKFNKTSEPKGKISKNDLSRFVVQEHYARNFHHDFRLEVNGVLKSWAVPKGVPLRKGIKRLAIEVEDHPVDYINFSGKIPEGEYGAGIVKIFDKGKFKVIKGSFKNKSIKINLAGGKLKGKYILAHLKDSKNWLLFKT